jgi:hypothetical protein
MARPPVSVADLRQLLASRFPGKSGNPGGFVPTGVPAMDEALGGGLALGRLTELVVAEPGCGGQSLLMQLLRTTRGARQRVALVDGADAFAPECAPPDALRHLVWVRCATVAQALGAADLLVRDGNYVVVIVDLCGCAQRELRRIPATLWHRMHRAAQTGGAVLIKTPQPLVPAVAWRLVLTARHGLAALRLLREAVVDNITVDIDRGYAQAGEERAG